MDQPTSYIKHDFRFLVILVVLMGLLIAGLWYLENTQGIFAQIAERFLTGN